MKNSNNSRSLKFKLMSLSLGVTLLLGAASLGVLSYIASTQEDAQLNSFEAYARNLSDAISAQFYERYGDVQTFSISPAVQSRSRETIVDTLNAFSAMYGIYDLILVVDGKGHLVAVNSKGPDGKEIATQPLYKADFSKEPWFKSTMEGQTTDDKDKGFSGTFVENVQVDPWTSQVLGGKKLGSSFTTAIRNAHGDVIGVISNRAGSRWFEVAFKELYSGLKKSGYAHAQLEMADKDGTVLYQYSPDPASTKVEESQYDWDQLLKLNLTSTDSKAAKEATAGRSGALVAHVAGASDRDQIIGYMPVNGLKFISKVGWSVYVKDIRSEAFEKLNRAERLFYGIFALIITLASAISYLFSTSLSKKLTYLANQLSGGSSEVSSAANQISASSSELSEAATEQAAAIQETAASIDEVSAMIKKSADNAAQSQKVSQGSRANAERGQEAVQEMTQAIGDISKSNASIMSQVEDGNRRISEIVKVIAEIGNKTKVINDIVFQTKLLSFNASVEAARAGDHGKGFAVVAEEVGNLAQMSGNAAKEISAMLDSSIQKVEGIVNETKSRVEKLVVDSREKVETGTQVAQKCGEAIRDILNTVQEVDGMVGEISSASKEQAQGVSEINKAMNQLDQVTQRNTGVSQQAATSAEQLSSQARDLRGVVSDLLYLINGQAGQAHQEINTSKMRLGESQTAPRVGNILRFKPKSQVPASLAAQGGLDHKIAVGEGTTRESAPQVPSKDDPRFEDV